MCFIVLHACIVRMDCSCCGALGRLSFQNTSAVVRRGDQAGAFKMWELLSSSQRSEPYARAQRSCHPDLYISFSLYRTDSYGRIGGQILNPSPILSYPSQQRLIYLGKLACSSSISFSLLATRIYCSTPGLGPRICLPAWPVPCAPSLLLLLPLFLLHQQFSPVAACYTGEEHQQACTYETRKLVMPMFVYAIPAFLQARLFKGEKKREGRGGRGASWKACIAYRRASSFSFLFLLDAQFFSRSVTVREEDI